MELREIAKRMMVSCLNVRAGEQVLIVTDDKKLPIGTARYNAAQDLGARSAVRSPPPPWPPP